MEVILGYGGEELKLETPPAPKCKTLVCTPHGKLEGGLAVDDALDNPIDSEPFSSLFKPGDTVTVIVPDITRYCGADIFLPPVLDRLNNSGVGDDAIIILFANGIHRKQTSEEKRSIVGDEVYRRIHSVDHDAKDKDHVLVRAEDCQARLNKLAVERGKLIITGAVGFHYLAGFGGGRKAVMPGVASYDDAKKFHNLCMNLDKPGRSASARAGILEGNPMSDYAFKIMNAVNPVFLINSVIEPGGKIAGVFAGDPVTAFIKACSAVKKMSTVSIDSLADVVVASCGGSPKDINFIQAHKTYEYSTGALKPGGKLYLAANCGDGIGSDDFIEWFKSGKPGKIEERLRQNFSINGHTALATAIKSDLYETHLLSRLDHDIVRAMGMIPANSADSFLSEASKALETAKCGIVIPQGGYILPVVAEKNRTSSQT
ncbi:MAG TPA: nickel-dependent lactate racemase [Nitrospirae bacterium]|nr:nickel-dependent lactate racemase [Nitrospirota bacterium]